MTLWPAVSILALLAVPASAEAVASGGSEAAASAPHDAAPVQQSRRPSDRIRGGASPCPGCAVPPTVRAPVTEAPNRALMLIPASTDGVVYYGRPGPSDEMWEGATASLAVAMAARRPPIPRP